MSRLSTRLPRLVATDLDGTLVGAAGRISPRSSNALHRIDAAGTRIVLVTGRSPRRLAGVYANLGTLYPAICANGAVVFDPAVGAGPVCTSIDAEVCEEVCRRLRRQVPEVVFAAEVDGGRTRWQAQGWSAPEDGDPRMQLRPGARVVKLMARACGHDSDALLDAVLDSVGDLVEATRPGCGGIVEMSRRGVTKGAALAEMAGSLSIPRAGVLAFGDMPNDVPMLRWAGRSVAVANAHPEARAAADECTLSNVDDGVAAYLERLLSPGSESSGGPCSAV